MFNFFLKKNLKKIFKENITQVSLEINSYCNRTCIYCPLSTIHREKKNMDKSLFNKILQELFSIKYENSFCLNVYNEPLLDFDHLISCISNIRKIFPSNTIRFSTNGDKLSREKIASLLSYKNLEVIVSCHILPSEEWNNEIFLERVKQKVELFQPNSYSLSADNNHILAQGQREDSSIVIFARNFIQNGNNRAGTVQKVLTERRIRTTTCFRPQHDFTISYDGTVYPCCQFCHGVKELLPYAIGNVNNVNIFTLYGDTKLEYFRNMVKNGPFRFPCDSCFE